MLQGHFTKIIKQNNTLSVSEGGLEESCFQITAKYNAKRSKYPH